jgi:hypothetical protein
MNFLCEQVYSTLALTYNLVQQGHKFLAIKIVARGKLESLSRSLSESYRLEGPVENAIDQPESYRYGAPSRDN